MRGPIVLRKTYEDALAQAWAETARADARILALEEQIVVKDDEIRALTALVIAPKVTKREEPAPKPPRRERQPGFRRGGWRAMAQHRSQQSAPQQADSKKALDAKVEREGGIV
jgi:hypothetical protein